ncbi:translation initiation factor IF-2-like [Rissa tridactyla]|uniref:translation initiation factor IF-2-like n=1 Tax=Rissa tridactyla TaxID=75485 RepID=UPI0023BA8034|nr:translation initiation factor IF-2-like [Rissa tridactyla]
MGEKEGTHGEKATRAARRPGPASAVPAAPRPTQETAGPAEPLRRRGGRPASPGPRPDPRRPPRAGSGSDGAAPPAPRRPGGGRSPAPGGERPGRENRRADGEAAASVRARRRCPGAEPRRASAGAGGYADPARGGTPRRRGATAPWSAPRPPAGLRRGAAALPGAPRRSAAARRHGQGLRSAARPRTHRRWGLLILRGGREGEGGPLPAALRRPFPGPPTAPRMSEQRASSVTAQEINEVSNNH